MALLTALLGLREPVLKRSSPKREYPVYRRRGGITCPNPFCITRQESERTYLAPAFWVVDPEALALRCLYCEHETTPRGVGRVSTKRYDTDISRWKRIPLDDLIMFDDESTAHAAGYQVYKSRTRAPVPGP